MNDIDILEEFIKEPKKGYEIVRIGSEEHKVPYFIRLNKKTIAAISNLISENKELKEFKENIEKIDKKQLDKLYEDAQKALKEYRETQNKVAKLEEENKELKNSGVELATTIDSLQTDLKELKEKVKAYETECRRFKAFCKKIRKDEKHDVDLFNQGQEQKCNEFLNLIEGEQHWNYEGKYFDETDKQIEDMKQSLLRKENKNE